jgi:hypothetical protein
VGVADEDEVWSLDSHAGERNVVRLVQTGILCRVGLVSVYRR